jgi:Uma2 family endonuclease
MVVPTPPKLTADEFLELHGDESRVDLVRGYVVRYPMPGPEHGYIGGNAYFELSAFARAHKLGRAMINDTFIRLADGTVRGADVCFISYARLPAGQKLPKVALDVMPEVVVEVRSPSDLWTEVFAKVGDYLDAGVAVVVVLDPATETATVLRPGRRRKRSRRAGRWSCPTCCPGSRCRWPGSSKSKGHPIR